MPNNPSFGMPPGEVQPHAEPRKQSRLITHPRSTIAEGILLGVVYVNLAALLVYLVIAFAWRMAGAMGL